MDLITNIEKQRLLMKAGLSAALLAMVGIGDYLTGYEISFSLFYILPIAFATWFIGRGFGVAAAVVSAMVWLSADLGSGHDYSHPFIPWWNTVIRLLIFIIITLLLSAFRNMLQREKELARIDYLTGAANSRQFYELLEREIERSRRYNHSFTLAYIDLDNFKTINDKYGHPTGDMVLCNLVSYCKTNLRKVDVVARLGGDEFALLLPQTRLEDAQAILYKLNRGLLDTMQRNNWPVTFSIGAVICVGAQYQAEQLIKMADSLMYSIKRESKNAIKYTHCSSQ